MNSLPKFFTFKESDPEFLDEGKGEQDAVHEYVIELKAQIDKMKVENDKLKNQVYGL